MAHPIGPKATLPPVPFQETPETEKIRPCQLGESQINVDSFLLQLWSSQVVLLYGMGRQSRGRAALPSSRKRGSATAAGARRGWSLAAGTSLPAAELSRENDDSSSQAPQHRADLSQGTQGSWPSHPRMKTRSVHRTHRTFQPTSASAFRMILSAKPLEFYFSEELEDARRRFHY